MNRSEWQETNNPIWIVQRITFFSWLCRCSFTQKYVVLSLFIFNNKLQLSWLSNDNIKWQTSHVLLLEQFQQRQERILSAASDEGTGLVWHFWNTEPTIKLCVAWLRVCCYSLGSQCQSEMCVCLTCRLFTIITDKLVQLKNIWMLFLVQLSKDHRFAINTQSNQWTWATDRPIHTNRIENKNM